MPPDFLTTAEAGRLLGIHPDTVRQQIHHGRITAIRCGRDWWIDRAEVERYARSDRTPGRKRA